MSFWFTVINHSHDYLFRCMFNILFEFMIISSAEIVPFGTVVDRRVKMILCNHLEQRFHGSLPTSKQLSPKPQFPVMWELCPLHRLIMGGLEFAKINWLDRQRRGRFDCQSYQGIITCVLVS